MSLSSLLGFSAAEDTRPEIPSVEVDSDDLFHLLQSERRRLAIRFAAERPVGEQVALRDMAAAVAIEQFGEPITSEDRKRVYIPLYQCHLEKLRDAGVVGFDDDRKADLVIGENARPIADAIDVVECEVTA